MVAGLTIGVLHLHSETIASSLKHIGKIAKVNDC